MTKFNGTETDNVDFALFLHPINAGGFQTPGDFFMKVGDRVRVKQSTVIYTHPEHRKQPFDIKGLDGEIVDILKDWKGRPISPNLPILVKFGKKFKVHFRDEELEVID